MTLVELIHLQKKRGRRLEGRVLITADLLVWPSLDVKFSHLQIRLTKTLTLRRIQKAQCRVQYTVGV